MERIAVAYRALKSLESILDEPETVIVRDATIQRFEYTSEATWKAVCEWLLKYESIEERHPRGCYRALFRIGRIDETLALNLLQLVEDRNRTSHAYIESVAVSVFERIPQHTKSLRLVLESIKNESP